MGVVYKLTDEVIDFVIQQKKEMPKISVRKLAELTSRTFDINVSKSSVNTILKDSSLSSPVGRRIGASVKHKGYKIPEQRKEQIFSAPPKPKKEKIPAPATPKIAEAPKKESVRSEVAKPHRLDKNEMSTQKPAIPAAPAASLKVSGERVRYDGMGSIFLKAAEWDLSGKSLLGGLFEEHIQGYSTADIHALSEILLYLEIFGVQRLEDLANYKGQGLWALSGVSSRLDYHVVTEMVKGIMNVPGFSLKVANEIPQILSEIGSVELVLEDDESFFVDAQFSTLWPENVHSGAVSPHFKLLSSLSTKIIHNVDPLILCSAPGQTGFSPELTLLIESFAFKNGRSLRRVNLYDESGVQMAQFTAIPQKRRHFILGAWPWHKEFELFKKRLISSPRRYLRDALHAKVSFQEVDLSASTWAGLNGFAVYEGEDAEPAVIVLSNFTSGEVSADKIVYSYIMRWPNLHRGHNVLLTSGNASALGTKAAAGSGILADPFMHGIPDLAGNIRALLLTLNNYAQRHFLGSGLSGMSINQLISIVYIISGYQECSAHFRKVDLILPKEGYNYQAELAQAVQRLNEGDVHDWDGRKLIVTL